MFTCHVFTCFRFSRQKLHRRGRPSLIGLLFLSPVFVIIALAIKRDSPGPVFYRGRRAGRGGREFHILKFRTMYERPESYQGAKVTAQDDPRITPMGKWLRDTKLNEVPQLWNVLKGDMSLVGPRPAGPHEWEQYEPWQRRKLSVTPGITCLWQVSGRNQIKDFDEWVELDLEYIDNWSLWLDLKILLRTVVVVLRGTGM